MGDLWPSSVLLQPVASQGQGSHQAPAAPVAAPSQQHAPCRTSRCRDDAGSTTFCPVLEHARHAQHSPAFDAVWLIDWEFCSVANAARDLAHLAVHCLLIALWHAAQQHGPGVMQQFDAAVAAAMPAAESTAAPGVAASAASSAPTGQRAGSLQLPAALLEQPGVVFLRSLLAAYLPAAAREAAGRFCAARFQQDWLRHLGAGLVYELGSSGSWPCLCAAAGGSADQQPASTAGDLAGGVPPAGECRCCCRCCCRAAVARAALQCMLANGPGVPRLWSLMLGDDV